MEHKNRVVVIDTETTGLTAKLNRIIEIACVEILDGQLTGSVFTSLVNPKGHRITQEAFRTHGIYDHELCKVWDIYGRFLDVKPSLSET